MSRHIRAGGRRIAGGLRYSLYLIFHPFKGFWDLKHERRGNLGSALCILAAVTLTFVMRSQLTGFLIRENDPASSSIFYQVTSVLLPFILWCAANWCITTLVDGEGFFLDILITSCYALVPLVLFNIPMVLLSHVITQPEAAFYHILDVASILWAVLLMLIGLMTTHQFSMSKTILTVVVALVGMAIMLFLFILFFSLIQNIVNFLRLLGTEIQMHRYA